jgi:hypothetical protein
LYCWASSWALRPDHSPGLPPAEPAIMRFFKRFLKLGLV